MRVYLDNCCFNRPYDDQSALRIRLETEAKLYVQEQVKSGLLALGWSYILDFENGENPCEERRIEIQRWKELADRKTLETPKIIEWMRQLALLGLKPFDALHVACAKEIDCDVFLTVDKGILRKVSEFKGVRVMTPVDFVMEQEGENG